MMVAIPKPHPEPTDPIATVKATVRIEGYATSILGYEMKRRGNGELWMRCPFHAEMTPSFHIRPKEQDFKCFGCGRGGDVIDLDMAVTGETNPRIAAEHILSAYGIAPERSTYAAEPIRIVPSAMPVTPGELSDAAVAWLAGRGISRAVAERNRVRGQKNAIEFLYINEGAVINRQTRTLSAKGFRFETGKPVIPFGLDDCDGAADVVIVEGVLDKLAIEEATGRTAVLAMPSATPGPDAYGLACQAVKDAHRVILAVDNDDAGSMLRDELVRRIGTSRCAVATWPDGCKDANDALLQSESAIRDTLAGAVDFPVEGVFTVNDSWSAIERLYEDGLPAGSSTGWPGLDRFYTVRRGQLTVITGTPGSGKSMFADAMVMNLAKASWEWTFAICSPEMQPLERHWATLMSLWSGKPFGKGPTERLDRETLRQAKEFLDDRFFMVLPEEPSVDAVIDKFLWTHRRYGVAGLLLDPWNELDHTRPAGMTETEYCNQELRKIKRVGWQHLVWIGLIAHPTKMYRDKEGKYPVPTLYDVSGSAAFFNKADNGIVIWRDKGDEARPVEVHVQKVRHQEIGGLGTAYFRHDKTTGRYWETRPL